MLGTPPAVNLAWLSSGQGIVDSCLNSGNLIRLGVDGQCSGSCACLEKMLNQSEKSGRVWRKGPGPVSFGLMAI